MAQLECNVGEGDRIFRIGTGALLIGVAAFAPIHTAFRVAAGAIGAMGLVTGAIRYCPVSKALNINTCS